MTQTVDISPGKRGGEPRKVWRITSGNNQGRGRSLNKTENSSPGEKIVLGNSYKRGKKFTAGLANASKGNGANEHNSLLRSRLEKRINSIGKGSDGYEQKSREVR